MQIMILAFAQAREAFGFAERRESCTALETPRAILQRIAPTVDLARLAVAVAVDQEYASLDAPIGASAKELALIPPVSGG